MNDQVDRTYYESTSWRSMRGCNNCAGYEPDDLGIGGVNQCKNGKYNGNGHLCNCDSWAPDFEQGLIDKVSQLESENAKLKIDVRQVSEYADELFDDASEFLTENTALKAFIERLTVVGTAMYDRIYGLYETGWTSYCPQDWEILIAEWKLGDEK